MIVSRQAYGAHRGKKRAPATADAPKKVSGIWLQIARKNEKGELCKPQFAPEICYQFGSLLQGLFCTRDSRRGAHDAGTGEQQAEGGGLEQTTAPNRLVIRRTRYSLFSMDSAAVKFGAVSMGLGLLAFVVMVAVWGGVGPCTDLSQLVLLIFALAGSLVGGAVLLISFPAVIVRRYKEDMASDAGTLFPRSDKKSDRL